MSMSFTPMAAKQMRLDNEPDHNIQLRDCAIAIWRRRALVVVVILASVGAGAFYLSVAPPMHRVPGARTGRVGQVITIGETVVELVTVRPEIEIVVRGRSDGSRANLAVG